MLFKNQKQIIENGQTKELKKARKDVLDILASSLNAVDPYKTVKSKFHGKSIVFEGETIDISDFKNIFLVGFGKASVGMAEAVCDSVAIKRGVVVTSDPNKKVRSDRVATFVGGHPIPNQKSIDGTEKILDVVR
jgi:glycerate-2-kinase